MKAEGTWFWSIDENDKECLVNSNEIVVVSLDLPSDPDDMGVVIATLKNGGRYCIYCHEPQYLNRPELGGEVKSYRR